MRSRAPQDVGPSRWAIPDPRRADLDGVVGVGADLHPTTLVAAYRRGVFPWPHEGMPLPWFSPDPRAVFWLDGVHVSRSLRRTLRRSGWTTTMDVAFDEVVRACGEDRDDGTWITPEMTAAYRSLHDRGWAHSLEVWDGQRLVGGVYGVLVGGVFTGESMFHRESDASKVGLLDLCRRLDEAGGSWLDAQLPTHHLQSLGAEIWPRHLFLRRLTSVRDADVRPVTDRLPVARLAT
jgi:leucyl/phenylalanyl-tRNA--protein transferase